MILIPWLGILVYLIARGKGMQQRQLEQARAMQQAQTEYNRSVAVGSSTTARPDLVGREPAGQRDDHPAEFDRLKAKALAA